jgi:hypothetical protein
MSTPLAVVILVLASCSPEFSGSHLNGTLSLTLTPPEGGEGVARAAPLDGKVCVSSWGSAMLKLGPECVLTAAYLGGSGALVRGQRCVLELGKTTTVLTVTTGALSEVGSTLNVSVGGLTAENPPRFVTFHFAGTKTEGTARPSCNDVIGGPPAASDKGIRGSLASRGRASGVLATTWTPRAAPSSE